MFASAGIGDRHDLAYVRVMLDRAPVRRLIYASRPAPGTTQRDAEAILAVSRRNNGIDGISGVLWSSGGRYLQLLEGTPEAIDAVFGRIAVDPRHVDVTVLEDVYDARRQFGDWSMAGLPGELPADAAIRLAHLVRDTAHEVGRHFLAAA